MQNQHMASGNKLVTQMDSLTSDTAKLVKNFKKLQGAVEMMKNLEASTSHFPKIEIAIQHVALMAERYFSGMSSLMDGKLNIDMVSTVVVSEDFTKVKEAAFSQGLETVFQDFTQLYQLPASYMAVGGPDQCDCGCSLNSHDGIWEIFSVSPQLFAVLFE